MAVVWASDEGYLLIIAPLKTMYWITGRKGGLPSDMIFWSVLLNSSGSIFSLYCIGLVKICRRHPLLFVYINDDAYTCILKKCSSFTNCYYLLGAANFCRKTDKSTSSHYVNKCWSIKHNPVRNRSTMKTISSKMRLKLLDVTNGNF